MDKKRGRPKKEDDSYAVWEKKYYRLSDARDNQVIRKSLELRLHKVYSQVFTLANDREPNQKDVGTINKAVGDILDRI
jgi:hypothetical protein